MSSQANVADIRSAYSHYARTVGCTPAQREQAALNRAAQKAAQQVAK